MKFYTYIKEIIKNNLSHQSFQIFLKLWNLNQITFLGFKDITFLIFEKI
jgi:hypothetical protein